MFLENYERADGTTMGNLSLNTVIPDSIVSSTTEAPTTESATRASIKAVAEMFRNTSIRSMLRDSRRTLTPTTTTTGPPLVLATFASTLPSSAMAASEIGDLPEVEDSTEPVWVGGRTMTGPGNPSSDEVGRPGVAEDLIDGVMSSPSVSTTIVQWLTILGFVFALMYWINVAMRNVYRVAYRFTVFSRLTGYSDGWIGFWFRVEEFLRLYWIPLQYTGHEIREEVNERVVRTLLLMGALQPHHNETTADETEQTQTDDGTTQATISTESQSTATSTPMKSPSAPPLSMSYSPITHTVTYMTSGAMRAWLAAKAGPIYPAIPVDDSAVSDTSAHDSVMAEKERRRNERLRQEEEDRQRQANMERRLAYERERWEREEQARGERETKRLMELERQKYEQELAAFKKNAEKARKAEFEALKKAEKEARASERKATQEAQVAWLRAREEADRASKEAKEKAEFEARLNAMIKVQQEREAKIVAELVEERRKRSETLRAAERQAQIEVAQAQAAVEAARQQDILARIAELEAERKRLEDSKITPPKQVTFSEPSVLAAEDREKSESGTRGSSDTTVETIVLDSSTSESGDGTPATSAPPRKQTPYPSLLLRTVEFSPSILEGTTISREEPSTESLDIPDIDVSEIRPTRVPGRGGQTQALRRSPIDLRSRSRSAGASGFTEPN